MLAGIVAIVGAVGAVRILEPGVDRLAMTLGIGIAAGPASPEAELFAANWFRLLSISNLLAALAFWLVLVGGIPLSGVALVAKYWPRSVSSLVRSNTAVWVCLTWQLTNVGFAALLMIFVASEVLDETTAAVILVSAVYLAVNLWAVRVWRELLLRMYAADVARMRPAV